MSSGTSSLSKQLHAARLTRRAGAVSLPFGLDSCPGYRLRERRGRGGFGEVWEAVTPTGERVALKFMRCDGAAAPREVRNLQQIRQVVHPHLIHAHKIFCYSGHLVLVMELAEGSLQDWLDASQGEGNQAVSGKEICTYLTQAAEVLDFLNTRQHRLGGQVVAIRHCDVKPSNMLLVGGVVKLADFGLAVKTGSTSQRSSSGGSADYAAPEVFSGSLSDRTDQYSLAVSYVQLRTGRLPFSDSPTRLSRDYVRPTPDLSGLPVAEERIVARALSPISVDRWSTCQELMAQLSRVVPA